MSGSAAVPAMRSGRVAWQLTVTLWVGGIWMLHFVLLPALESFGLAPMLTEEIGSFMRPLMVAFAAVCAVLQLVIVWSATGVGWWKDLRGQLLMLVLAASAIFFSARSFTAAVYIELFCYLVVAFAGLILILQPRPDEAGR
ncbi:DUF4149 domain-containing protein [Pseudomonas sp. OIL-1]|uniref:DUF4149 domain-containing protein n=1 Tax=Pseudomonas sp. OIL-1 TaxID=2706126 RepID=UPI0021151F87|nr:DUF4149 domain-containing protein [Pseudomonas sp. OIL-1]